MIPTLPSERRCYETGALLPADALESARFVSNDARTAWGNRRKTRGAMLYDLIMVWRHARPWAKKLKVISIICRLAAEWYAEDKKADRRSFGDPQEIVSRFKDK